MKDKDNEHEFNPVQVFAGSMLQAGFVKSLLEDAEIEAYFRDSIIGTLAPWWSDPGGAGAVKIYVSAADQEKAEAIVDKYIRTLNED